MATVDFLRDQLIDKLLTINDKELLEALDKLLLSKTSPDKKIKLTDAQRRMIELSEDDIEHGRTISQDQIDKDDMEWLNGG